MKIKKENLFITIGLLFIFAALILALYNFFENADAKKKSEISLAKLKTQIDAAENISSKTEIPLYESYKEMSMPKINIDGSTYVGVLSIPSLNLELPIRAEFSYKGLTTAPCLYKGSVYTDDMIVAGHNYSAHFGGLKRLKIDDEVSFIDAEGNVFRYHVAEIQQISGADVEGMTSGDWDLTLFTCTLSGKARVTVRLDRVGD